MVSVPVSGSSGLGSSPYRGHYYRLCSCTTRHLTLTEPFSTLECKWVQANLLNGGGGGWRNTPSSFMLLNPGYSLA